MTRSPYEWEPGSPPPIIQQHSIVKHEILRAYISEYIQTLVSNPNREEFRLVLIDGFAGGGVYRHARTGQEVLGSPFIMLEAATEAEALINVNRRKPVKLAIDYIFIEKDRATAQYLQNALTQLGHGHRIGRDVTLRLSAFESAADELIELVRRKMPRAQRAIFLLDQYGYSDVPTARIAKIMGSLPGSEIILTFAVDALLTYFSEKHEVTKRILQKVGIPEVLRGRSFDDIKRSDASWRLMIQACLYQELVQKCQAPYYTLFFIRSDRGHGDYWLVHLSHQPRARDVMTRIHWQNNNHFIHYGGPGLDMFDALGYVSRNDPTIAGHQPSLFEFDTDARQASVDHLARQIPPLIHSSGEMTFGRLFALTCNLSPASADIYRDAVDLLRAHHQIEVISSSTGKPSRATVQDQDRIARPAQGNLFLFGP